MLSVISCVIVLSCVTVIVWYCYRVLSVISCVIVCYRVLSCVISDIMCYRALSCHSNFNDNTLGMERGVESVPRLTCTHDDT